MLSRSGALTNPFEYREVMESVVGWNDKSVAEVTAEQEQRRKDRGEAAASSNKAPTPGASRPRQGQMDAFNELVAIARRNDAERAAAAEAAEKPAPKRKPRQKPPAE